MKCLENKVAIAPIHEALEDAGEWINVRDGDAYLSGYFSHIGVDDANVSIFINVFEEQLQRLRAIRIEGAE